MQFIKKTFAVHFAKQEGREVQGYSDALRTRGYVNYILCNYILQEETSTQKN